MLSEQILGSLEEERFQGKEVDYVDIEWHEAFKKLHKKTTHKGMEIGIRLGDGVLTRGLMQNDVLYETDSSVVAVNIPACESILITVDEHHPKMLMKVCYEIGNKHAALFWGERNDQLITPYNGPTLAMLQKLHGVTAEVKEIKLDFNKRISAVVHSHTH